MRSLTFGAAGEEVVTFVNRFSLHCPDGQFEQAFVGASAYMESRPGFLGHALMRRADEGDRPGYVNIALWRDEASLRAAVGHPDFAAHAAALRALATSEPAIYRPRLGAGPGLDTWLDAVSRGAAGRENGTAAAERKR